MKGGRKDDWKGERKRVRMDGKVKRVGRLKEINPLIPKSAKWHIMP